MVGSYQACGLPRVHNVLASWVSQIEVLSLSRLYIKFHHVVVKEESHHGRDASAVFSKS